MQRDRLILGEGARRKKSAPPYPASHKLDQHDAEAWNNHCGDRYLQDALNAALADCDERLGVPYGGISAGSGDRTRKKSEASASRLAETSLFVFFALLAFFASHLTTSRSSSQDIYTCRNLFLGRLKMPRWNQLLPKP